MCTHLESFPKLNKPRDRGACASNTAHVRPFAFVVKRFCYYGGKVLYRGDHDRMMGIIHLDSAAILEVKELGGAGEMLRVRVGIGKVVEE